MAQSIFHPLVKLKNILMALVKKQTYKKPFILLLLLLSTYYYLHIICILLYFMKYSSGIHL